MEHVRRRVDHAQRAIDVERARAGRRAPRTAATARPGTRRRRGCTPSRDRPRRSTSSCVNDDGGTRSVGSPSAAARASAAAGAARAASRRSRRSARTRGRTRARRFSGRATYGVATTFSVWRRLSKISSVSVTTMRAAAGRARAARAPADPRTRARSRRRSSRPRRPRTAAGPARRPGACRRAPRRARRSDPASPTSAVRGGPSPSTSYQVTVAVPALHVTTARGATPTNEYAAQVAPPTTDSSRNAVLARAERGVRRHRRVAVGEQLAIDRDQVPARGRRDELLATRRVHGPGLYQRYESAHAPRPRQDDRRCRPRNRRADRRRRAPPARLDPADRVGELRLGRRARRDRLGPDEQVQRGLPGASATTRASSTSIRSSRSASTARRRCSAPTTRTCSRTPARPRTSRSTSRSCKPGDTVMGLGLPAGGHLTHGWNVSITGSYFQRGAVRRPQGHASHRPRRGPRARAEGAAEADVLRRHRDPAHDRLPGVRRDRERGRRDARRRHRAHRRARRRWRAPVAGRRSPTSSRRRRTRRCAVRAAAC